MSKYGNVQSGANASKREAKRGVELRLLEKAGEITELREQQKFKLLPTQYDQYGRCIERAVTYTCDYSYRTKHGHFLCEDAKGVRTQQYILRRKMMLYFHGIRVREV